MFNENLYKESFEEEYDKDFIDKLEDFAYKVFLQYKDVKSKEKNSDFGNFISKLIPKKEENLSYYVIKNRRVIISLMLISALLSNANVKDKDSNSIAVEFYEPTTGYELLLNDGYKLVRTYRVVSGDTLSSISSYFNTSIESIVSESNLLFDKLRENQILKIPYYISNEHLDDYTTVVRVSDYENFESIAEAFDTDLKTLYSLNVDKFVNVNGEYSFISDTILVPVFPENNYSLKKSFF